MTAWVRRFTAKLRAKMNKAGKPLESRPARSEATLTPAEMDRAGKLENAAHPVIIPKKDHITRLTVADVHNRCRHAGVNCVLAQVRHHYWIIDGRQEVENWDEECKACERRRAKPAM